MINGPRIACIPVSWPTGLGEYARLLTLAKHGSERWPDARFRFLLNRHAEISPPEPFEASTIETSPTLDTPGVVSFLQAFRPHLALFDNTAQVEQLRCARELGARIVYLSTRQNKQWLGMKMAWRRLVDEHWVIDPPIGGSARLVRWAWEGLLGTSRLRYLESLFTPPDADRALHLNEKLGIGREAYVLFVAGGGGGSLRGRWAADLFAEAAQRVQSETGTTTTLAQGPLYRGPRLEYPGVHIETSLSHEDVVDLLAGAKLVVAGASSSSFQALALRKVLIATSTGGEEQIARVHRWARAGIWEPSSPDPAALSAAAIRLLHDAERFRAIEARVGALALGNGLGRAIDAMERLLTSRLN